MFYTHGTLDRADRLRRDERALTALRHDERTRLLPVWRGTVLVTGDDETDGGGASGRGAGGSGASARPARSPRLASLSHDVELPDGEAIFLGLVDGVAHFAVPVGALDDGARAALAARASTPDGNPRAATFEDLRVVGPTLPANEGALLAYARGLVYWSENTRFCERCGRPLASVDGGHVRRCANPDGAHVTFPRTDPAVIMLVVHEGEGDTPSRCLLGRSPAWPEGVFSTLAGFVEPGESLEQAVAREVFEESGIETRDVRYIASQPWPFPRSIMLGFEAAATTTAISVDPDELADARWFTREEIGTFGSWGDAAYALQLPRPDSIARFLIDRWVGGG